MYTSDTALVADSSDACTVRGASVWMAGWEQWLPWLKIAQTKPITSELSLIVRMKYNGLNCSCSAKQNPSSQRNDRHRSATEQCAHGPWITYSFSLGCFFPYLNGYSCHYTVLPYCRYSISTKRSKREMSVAVYALVSATAQPPRYLYDATENILFVISSIVLRAYLHLSLDELPLWCTCLLSASVFFSSLINKTDPKKTTRR